MFNSNIDIIKNSFIDFMGSGMYVALFFISMLYLYLKEDNPKIRAFLVYFPILVLLVTWNPLFNKLVDSIFTLHTYWRMYWMLPLGISIAYSFIKFTSSFGEKKKRIIVTISLFIIILVSGRNIYTKANYTKVGNIYRLPDESILVAQLIGADESDYKKAIVPETIVAHIRQIDATIDIAYRREPTGYGWQSIPQILSTGYVPQIVRKAYITGSNYIVFRKETILSEPFEYYGFEKINETTSFFIYKFTGDADRLGKILYP